MLSLYCILIDDFVYCLLSIVAYFLFLHAFTLVYPVFLPGFAGPYWISYDLPTGTRHAGLWRVSTQK